MKGIWYQREQPQQIETQCKTVLHPFTDTKDGLTVNPYVGCGHRCLYCYATYEWVDDFYDTVKVKVNANEALIRDTRKLIGLAPPIMFSSATDAYQPAEAKYKLTRRMIQTVGERGLSYYIFTKSTLVLRDLDLHIRNKDRCLLVWSLATVDDSIKRLIEPGTPSSKAILAAMRKAAQNGLRVGVNIDPVIPFLTDGGEHLRKLVRACLESGAGYFGCGILRLRDDILRRVRGLWSHVGWEARLKLLEDLYFSKPYKKAGYFHAPSWYVERTVSMLREFVEQSGGTFGLPIDGMDKIDSKSSTVSVEAIPRNACYTITQFC